MCRLINLSAIFVIISVILNLVYTIPLPQNGMFYYQTPMYYTPNQQQSVHHAMLLHYGQPYQTNGQRSNEGGLSAFASGDTIAAGTYLRDCKPIDSQTAGAADTRQQIHPYVQQNEPEINSADDEDENAVAVAAAYPGADEPSDEPTDGQNDDEEGDIVEQQPNYNEVLPTQPKIGIKKKTPKYLPPTAAAAIQPTESFGTESSTTYEIEADTTITPQINNNSRRRRVRVELETPNENNDDNVNESDLSPYYPRQRPQQNGSGRPSHNNNNNNNNNGNGNQQNPLPANTFFPVNFGKTSGGAIAIANSYSTGKGGSATSHATAYGSPSNTRPRARLTNAQY